MEITQEETYRLSETNGKENKNQAQESLTITFRDIPVIIKCPYCLLNIQTEIIAKTEPISLVLGITLFALLPNIATVIFTILLVNFLPSRKHRCPSCERELGSDGKFLRIFTDEVYSCEICSSGIIVSKKIIFTVTLIALIFTVITIKAAWLMRHIDWSEASWDQVHKDCLGSNQQCVSKYQGKQFINWKGNIMRISDYRNDRSMVEHCVLIFLKMSPQSRSETEPDLLLTMSKVQASFQNQLLNSLSHQDEIMFNCTLHSRKLVVDGQFFPHFHANDIVITGNKNEMIQLYVTEEEAKWIVGLPQSIQSASGNNLSEEDNTVTKNQQEKD